MALVSLGHHCPHPHVPLLGPRKVILMHASRESKPLLFRPLRFRLSCKVLPRNILRNNYVKCFPELSYEIIHQLQKNDESICQYYAFVHSLNQSVDTIFLPRIRYINKNKRNLERGIVLRAFIIIYSQ